MGIIFFPLFSSGLKYFFFIQSVCVLYPQTVLNVWVLMCIFGRNKMCVVEITFVFYVLPFLFGYYSLQHLSSLVTHKKMWFQCYILRKKMGKIVESVNKCGGFLKNMHFLKMQKIGLLCIENHAFSKDAEKWGCFA